jgi:uncharacterized protein
MSIWCFGEARVQSCSLTLPFVILEIIAILEMLTAGGAYMAVFAMCAEQIASTESTRNRRHEGLRQAASTRYNTGMDQLLKDKREEIRQVAASHGATDIRLFGSRARGEAGEANDVDLLVKLAPGRTLLDLVAIKQDLEDLLGCSVDVVTEESISPYIRSQVLKDAVAL